MEPFRTSLEQVTFSPSDHQGSSDLLDSFSTVVSYDSDLFSDISDHSAVSPQNSFQAVDQVPLPSRSSVPVPGLTTSNTSSQWSYTSHSQYGEDGIVNINFQPSVAQQKLRLARPVKSSLVCTSRPHPAAASDATVELAAEAVETPDPEVRKTRGQHVTLPAEVPGVHAHGDQAILAKFREARRRDKAKLAKAQVQGHTGQGHGGQGQGDCGPVTGAGDGLSEALALQRETVGGSVHVSASEEQIALAIQSAKQKLDSLVAAQENSLLFTTSLGGHSLPSNHVPRDNHVLRDNHVPRVNNQPRDNLTFTQSPRDNLTFTMETNHVVHGRTNGSSPGPLSPPLTPTSPTSLIMPRGHMVSASTGLDSPLPLNSLQHSVSTQNGPVSPHLIPIPRSEITVTKEGGKHAKTYQMPNDDLKKKLKAKAKANAQKGSNKARGKKSPSEQGSETGRSTPSEFSDSEYLKVGSDSLLKMSLDSLDNPHPMLNSDESEVSGRLGYLDSSDFLQRPTPVTSSTPLGTPGKVPLNQEITRTDPSDVSKLLREKAHLQGQIEVLKSEAQTAVKDRSDLQAQLGAFKSQFKSSSGSGNWEKDGVLADLHSIKVDRDRLLEREQKLQKLLEEKTKESSVAKVELDSSKKTNLRLQSQLDSSKQNFSGKMDESDELRNRLGVAAQELQTLRQEKRTMENELRSTRNEIQAMSKTKDWYQAQLKAAQETRSSLQKDVSKMQIQAMEQSSAIERLKSENTHIKHQMSESQQRALQEKENLVKHLEKIEADMLEREAAVQQLRTDKTTNESSLYERIKKVEEEKHQMAALLMTTKDLQNDVAKLRTEMTQKDAQIALMEKDHTEMIKQLTLKQEMVTERQQELETLQSRFVELDAKMKEMSEQNNHKDSDILSLKEQKAALEVALSSANDEKRTIDTTLDTLRSDMVTVENSFKMMKVEMSKKNQNLKELKMVNANLEHELNQSRAMYETQQKSFNELNQDMSGKFAVLNELTVAKDKLANETTYLTDEISRFQNLLRESNQDRARLQEKVAETEGRVRELGEKLSVAVQEKQQLQNSVQEADSAEVEQVRSENTNLRGEMTELQVSYNQVLDRKQKELEQVEKELWSTQERLDDAKARHAEEMRVVGDRLKEAGEAQHRAEWQLREAGEAQHRADQLEETGRREEVERERMEERRALQAEIESLRSALYASQSEVRDLHSELQRLTHQARADAQQYQSNIDNLSRELWEARETLTSLQTSQDENAELALELEREKGRLQGVVASHSALKQHAAELEALLAQKESALVDLTLTTQHKLNETSCLTSATQQRVEELERRLEREHAELDDVRQQLSAEKLNAATLQKQTETLSSDLDRSSHDLETVMSQLEAVTSRQAAVEGREEGVREELGRVQAELEGARMEANSLRRQLEQTRERDPVMDDTIKALEWESEQKAAELAAWREQTRLADERQQLEMDGARKTLQSVKNELDRVRGELSRTKKEKFNHQAKLSELRGTLKACLRGEVGDEDRDTESPLEGATGPEPEPREGATDPQSVLAIIEKILDDASTPDYDSKPLAALHQCMASLRGQMTGLQTELDQHALAVINSSHNWKQVEERVRELRDLCSSDDCSGSVVSDADSQATSETAHEIVHKLLGEGATGQTKQQTGDDMVSSDFA